MFIKEATYKPDEERFAVLCYADREMTLLYKGGLIFFESPVQVLRRLKRGNDTLSQSLDFGYLVVSSAVLHYPVDIQ